MSVSQDEIEMANQFHNIVLIDLGAYIIAVGVVDLACPRLRINQAQWFELGQSRPI